MMKFWFMYWLSSVQFSYLGLSKGKEKASEFIECFSFIMHMKNLVKLQLSMRKLAQIYSFVEPKLAKESNDLEIADKTVTLTQD